MAETQTNPGKLGKCSFIFGIIAVVVALLPYLSTWFLLVSWLTYIFGAVGIILGVIAFVKKQQKAILGLVLCLASCVGYYFISNSDYIAKKSVENAAEAVGGVMQMSSDVVNWASEQNEKYQ